MAATATGEDLAYEPRSRIARRAAIQTPTDVPVSRSERERKGGREGGGEGGREEEREREGDEQTQRRAVQTTRFCCWVGHVGGG